MSIDNFSARLKAEICRNKAKSAVLAVMCLVAAYFWVPLLGKWFGNGSTEETEIAVVDTVDSVTPATNVKATEAKTITGKSEDWRAAISRLRKEPLMTSANCFSLTRNPFAKLSIPNVIQVLEDEEAEEKTEEKQTVSPPDPTPPAFDKLGLVLNGTMVGNRSRMATINAKNYQERQEIIIVAAESENEGQLGSRSANPTVLIEAIHSGYVVVSYDGQLHELRLQPLTLSQSGRIVVNRLPLEIVDN